MADAGVSSQQTQCRLLEVRRAYRHAFLGVGGLLSLPGT